MRTAPKLFAGMATVVLFLATAAIAQKPEELAQRSAESWLTLVDAGKYGNSWQEAASMFKAAVNKEQ
jgi:hypothetical protein